MPQAWVFDAYGTLFDVHSVARACEEFWPAQRAALAMIWRTKQLEYTWLRSLMGRYQPFSQVTREALEWTCDSLRLETSPQQLDAVMASYLHLDVYSDVRETLEKLDGRKAILSNGSPDMLNPLVDNSSLSFDAILSVDEVKVYKPSPKVYQLAVDRLGTRDISFVSSNCWDALGAKSFGFRVYWINRSDAPVDRLGFQPDEVLRSLGDLK